MKTFPLILHTVFLLCFASLIQAQQGGNVRSIVDRQIQNALNPEMQRLIDTTVATGMVVGVVADGKIVHMRAYGLYDARDSTPFDVKQAQSWASVSKLPTAIAAWQLMTRYPADFTLDTTAGEVLGNSWSSSSHTDFKKKSEATVRQLLAHRSGIRGYKGAVTPSDPRGIHKGDWKTAYSRVRTLGTVPEWNPTACINYYRDKSMLDIRRLQEVDSRLWHAHYPHRYSSFGTCVLGAMIEQTIKNLSKEGKLQERLPENTYYGWVRSQIATPAGLRNLQVNKGQRFILPGGGWQSDIEDMTKFMIAMMNEDLVPMSDLYAVVPNNSGYGLGVRLRRGANNIWYVGHGGSQGLVRSTISIRATGNMNPTVHNSNFGVAVMINGKKAKTDTGSDANARRVVDLVYSALNP
ncbi:MAG: CubicO group peptidase (beta-lactamase class C family) [Verrucomicrobiales bacterium]|jgi:CubicO group peptidase (beta-lactamase class C family)